MIQISHAILHAFDFESGQAYPSERELSLDVRPVRSYVQRTMRKLSASAESRHGSFLDNNAFNEGLSEYLAGSVSFVDFSQQLARFLWEQLRMCDELEECDVLLADFSDSSTESATTAQSAAATEFEGASEPFTVNADEEDLSHRYFACVILPRRQAFIHDLANDTAGANANDIVRHNAILPNPSQKLESYFVVDVATRRIDFLDKPRSLGGQEIEIIPEKLLCCEAQASSKEVVQQVEQIVEDIAQEHGLNVTEAVAHAKALVTQSAEREETISPELVGRQVFEDRPDVAEHFERSAREKELPEEVPVKRSVANRLAKNHKIKTDTGIEISFPSEYATNSNYIEFTAAGDGSVSILIKNVGHIENK